MGCAWWKNQYFVSRFGSIAQMCKKGLGDIQIKWLTSDICLKSYRQHYNGISKSVRLHIYFKTVPGGSHSNFNDSHELWYHWRGAALISIMSRMVIAHKMQTFFSRYKMILQTLWSVIILHCGIQVQIGRLFFCWHITDQMLRRCYVHGECVVDIYTIVFIANESVKLKRM